MIKDLLANKTNVHYAKILALGILFQGCYQYTTTGKLKFCYFFIYVVLSFICALLYYKIFSE